MSEDRGRFRGIAVFGGLAAAIGALAVYRRRDQLRIAAGDVARRAAESLAAPTELATRSARQVGRIALLPADATLELARDRVLSGLPVPADAKWRVTNLLIRSTIIDAVGDQSGIGEDLEAAGRIYAEASLPEGGWDALTLRETLRRVTHALDMVGAESRDGETVEVITTLCPIIEAADPALRPGVCDVVCGPGPSLLRGIATTAGARLEAPERMGDGDARCRRRLALGGSGV